MLIPNSLYGRGIQILRICIKQMNFVKMSSIYCRTLGSLVLGWAPNNFILGAQLAPGEKMLVCIPAIWSLQYWKPFLPQLKIKKLKLFMMRVSFCQTCHNSLLLLLLLKFKISNFAVCFCVHDFPDIFSSSDVSALQGWIRNQIFPEEQKSSVTININFLAIIHVFQILL